MYNIHITYMNHRELSPYDINGWKCKLDKTNTSMVNFFSKPQGPFLRIYVYFSILNNIFLMHILEKTMSLPCMYYVR